MAEDEGLGKLIASVMHGNQPMTEKEIVKAIHRRATVKTDARRVRRFLYAHPGWFSRISRRLRLVVRWRLVEAGPADDPGNTGSPVPAWPYRPSLSGASAVPLMFREDEPPTNAIGRTA
jgi:hypothetical protein